MIKDKNRIYHILKEYFAHLSMSQPNSKLCAEKFNERMAEVLTDECQDAKAVKEMTKLIESVEKKLVDDGILKLKHDALTYSKPEETKVKKFTEQNPPVQVFSPEEKAENDRYVAQLYLWIDTTNLDYAIYHPEEQQGF